MDGSEFKLLRFYENNVEALEESKKLYRKRFGDDSFDARIDQEIDRQTCEKRRLEAVLTQIREMDEEIYKIIYWHYLKGATWSRTNAKIYGYRDYSYSRKRAERFFEGYGNELEENHN